MTCSRKRPNSRACRRLAEDDRQTDAVVAKTCLAKRPGGMVTQQSAPPSQASPFPRLPVLFVPLLLVAMFAAAALLALSLPLRLPPGPSVGMPLSILMRSGACGQDRHQPSPSSPPSAPWVTILGAGCIRLFRSRRYQTAPGCSGAVVSLPWLSEARASERHVVLARSRHCRDPFVFCVDGGWVSALQAYRRRINRVEAMVRSNVTVMRMNETAPPNGQLFCCAKVEKTSGPMVWNFGPPRSTGVA